MLIKNKMFRCILRIIVFIIPVGIYFAYNYVKQLQTMWFVVPTSILAFMLCLYAWPELSLALHRKSFTLEDLQDKDTDDDIQKNTKKLFRNIFMHILIITTSIAVGVIVDFAVIRFQRESKLSFVEACGIIGGLLTLLKRIHMICGSILLKGIACFMKCKQKQQSITLN